MPKQKEFHTLLFVVDAKDFTDAEEVKCKILKFLQVEGIYVYETTTMKGWKSRKSL